MFIDSDLQWQDHINYVYNTLVKFTSILYKIKNKLPQEVLKKIHLFILIWYMVLKYMLTRYTTSNHLSKLTVLNNKLLHILQYESMRTHRYELCINIVLLFLYNCYISIKFLYLCIITGTVGPNYLLYFQLILKKIN